MKSKRPIILHLTTDVVDGAGEYTMNVHRHMIRAGYSSYVAVHGESILCPDGASIIIQKKHRCILDKGRRKLYATIAKHSVPMVTKYAAHNMYERFMCYNPTDLVAALSQKPDVIFVHWVSGYANARYVHDLQRLTGARVIHWVLDDALLSGACHYPWDCEQYQTGCKQCPMTESKYMQWHIRRNFRYKQHYMIVPKEVIVPTEMDRKRVEKSLLWHDAQIHKMLEYADETRYVPAKDRKALRELFNIPEGKRVVFFGCTYLNDERKGMPVLAEAIKKIDRDDVIYLAAGRFELPIEKDNIIKLGYLNTDTLIKAYQAADCFVCSSLEDSGPQMINQSMMCGTPVVAFEMGVALDLVKTGQTGYLAKWNDAEDLAKGINYMLDVPDEVLENIKKQCRTLALTTHSTDVLTDLFNRILLQNDDSI